MTINVTLEIKGKGLQRWDVDFHRGSGDNHVELRDPRRSTSFTVSSYSTYLVSYIVRGKPNTDFEIIVDGMIYHRHIGKEGVDASSFYVGI